MSADTKIFGVISRKKRLNFLGQGENLICVPTPGLSSEIKRACTYVCSEEDAYIKNSLGVGRNDVHILVTRAPSVACNAGEPGRHLSKK